MTRLNLIFALSALPAPIAVPAAIYSAVPAQRSSESRIIGRDIVWRCGPDNCSGSSDASRPIVLCQNLARQAGRRIDKFIADGRALDASALAKCNTAAADRASPALAKTN